jgi:pimeloyl-ACP methyl ester carboxylesterase
MFRPSFRRSPISTRTVAVASGLLGTLALAVALPAEASSRPAPPKPTVVFVHGAFADSSGWNDVMRSLRKDGYPVRAASNPLRGLAGDSAYVASFLQSITGPIIVVGHSYGGAVITNAAAGDADVKALVYVAAFAPDAGESLGALINRPVAHPVPALPLQPVTVTEPDGSTGADLYLDPAKFRATFAADVDPHTAAVMAATQRPVDAAGFVGASGTPAWKTIPSWYLVATRDRALAPDLERFMAERAGAHTVEVNSSHAAMVSHPDAVTSLIERADRGTR